MPQTEAKAVLISEDSMRHKSTNHAALFPGDKMWLKIDSSVLSSGAQNTGWHGSGKVGRDVAPVAGEHPQVEHGQQEGKIQKQVWGQLRDVTGAQAKGMRETSRTNRTGWGSSFLGSTVKLEFYRWIWPQAIHSLHNFLPHHSRASQA